MHIMKYLKILLIIAFLSTILPSPCLDNSQEKNFNPKPASASIYNLGLKSYEQGDLESATTYFKRAVDLDPEFVDAYYNLGAIYKRQKNYPLAINAFQKAVDLNTEDLEATYELASCYFEEKNYEKAKKYFSSLPTTFVKYDQARNNIEIIQAQLLANTLTNTETQGAPQHLQITKPSEEAFKGRFRTITGNFNGPTGIAKDSKNSIYIANFTKDRIERITQEGLREIFIDKIGIQGPVGLAFDESDNLYVANYNGNSIVRITPNKQVSILVNKIIRPYYLFYDTSRGKLFATIQGNDSLVEIDTSNISKEPITSR